MRAKITKSFVDSLNHAAHGADIHWDDDLKGFGVRANANGSKTYVVQYRMGGREANPKRITIGKHGSPWTTAEARAEAKLVLAKVAIGVDPQKAAAPQKGSLLFENAVDSFRDQYLKLQWPRTWNDADRLLRAQFLPVFGHRPVDDIPRAEVSAVLHSLADRPARMRYAHAVARLLFKWLAQENHILASPLQDATPPRPVPRRERVLSPKEVWAVWRAAELIGYPFGDFARIAIITAQRRSEVIGMRWSEIHNVNGANPVWVVAGARMKMERAHRVPLSSLAVAELNRLQNENGDLLFTSTGTTPASGFSKAKKRIDAEIAIEACTEIPGWRWHDVRRTAATGMQACGIPVEVTEAVLSHTSGTTGGVAGVYNQYKYEPEKRKALDRWGSCIAWLDRCQDVSAVSDDWSELWLAVVGITSEASEAESSHNHRSRVAWESYDTLLQRSV